MTDADVPTSLAKARLSQSGFGPKVMNLPGDVGVGQLCFEGFGLRLVIANIAVVCKFKGLRGESGHGR